jgi:hypothetical protein
LATFLHQGEEKTAGLENMTHAGPKIYRLYLHHEWKMKNVWQYYGCS